MELGELPDLLHRVLFCRRWMHTSGTGWRSRNGSPSLHRRLRGIVLVFADMVRHQVTTSTALCSGGSKQVGETESQDAGHASLRFVRCRTESACVAAPAISAGVLATGIHLLPTPSPEQLLGEDEQRRSWQARAQPIAGFLPRTLIRRAGCQVVQTLVKQCLFVGRDGYIGERQGLPQHADQRDAFCRAERSHLGQEVVADHGSRIAQGLGKTRG